MAMKTAFIDLPLKTGTLIVAWLQTAIVAAYLSVAVVMVINPEKFSEEFRREFHDEKLTDYQNSLKAIIGLLLLDLVVLIALLYGTYQSRAGFLLPYIVFFGLQDCLFVVSMLKGMHTTAIVVQILVTVILFYFLCVVGSFYKQLRAGNQDLKNSV